MSKLLSKDSDALDESMRSRVLSAEYAEELQAPIIAICMVLGLLGGSQLLHLGGHELLLAAILLVRLVNTFGFVQRGSQRLMMAQVWLGSARSLIAAAGSSQEQLTGTVPPDPAAGVRFEEVSFKHADGKELLAKVDFEVAAGKITTLVGAIGRRQDHDARSRHRPAAAALRPAAAGRRGQHRGRPRQMAAGDRLRAAGRHPVPRHRAQQRRAGRGELQRRGCLARPARGRRGRVHRSPAGRPRPCGGRARPDDLRRPAPAHRARPRTAASPGDPDPRRGDRRPRPGDRRDDLHPHPRDGGRGKG